MARCRLRLHRHPRFHPQEERHGTQTTVCRARPRGRRRRPRRPHRIRRRVPRAGRRSGRQGGRHRRDVRVEVRLHSQACTDTLGPAGYGYVQVSPPQEHIQGGQWWTSYQPVSYKIAGRLGDRAAFSAMVNTCHAAGVKAVADSVINHMSAGNGTGTGGSAYTKYDYPGLYSGADMDDCRTQIGNNYNDRGNVQNCELVGLADLTPARTTYAGRSPGTSTTCSRSAWTASASTPRSTCPPPTWPTSSPG